MKRCPYSVLFVTLVATLVVALVASVTLGRYPIGLGELVGILGQKGVSLLEKLGLPTSTAFDAKRAAEYLRHDKKASGSKTVTTVRVDEPGTYRLEKTTFEELEALLSSDAFA